MARNGVDTSSSAREICWGEHMEVFSTPKVVVVFPTKTCDRLDGVKFFSI